jgi:GH24 family phage-related lysozyme (muramidase)
MIYFTSQNGIDFIKSFESFSPIPYICPGGMRTIGYGHVLAKGEYYGRITLENAKELLKRDLSIIETAVIRNINIALSQNQFDSLVSFTFNVGAGSLQRSSLRQKINYCSSTDEISQEFLRWVYANGTKLQGLVRRRMFEAMVYCGR